MSTRVVIIGAGALGKCLAALLADHVAVILYDRKTAVRRALRKGRIVFREKKNKRTVKVQAVSSLEQLSGVKIETLIFATKVRDLKAAVREAAGLKPRHVFFPQNGLFDVEWAKRYFKSAKICRGVTTMACRETGPNQATLFYRGHIYAGGDGAKQVAALFCRSGIAAKAYGHADGPVWAKLIFSAVMNPLPVFTGQGYDILKRDPNIWKLVKQAVEEGRAVARALGMRLAFDPLRLIQRVRNGDLAGIAHKGTIFQDISARRPTELDFITGALVREARKLRMATPALNLILAKTRAAGA